MKTLFLNWKMNPETFKEAMELAHVSNAKGVVVIPPYLFLYEVRHLVTNAKLGAQDLFWEKKGAFTGEISGEELKAAGVAYVIIGHSERRHILNESDEVVAKKMKAVIEAGLIPILCVGETEEEKNAGKREQVVRRQITSALLHIPRRYKINAQRLYIAYEPVWAIGTGNPQTPEDADRMAQYIRSILDERHLKARILYGGSVNAILLKKYIQYKSIDGALVGGASLKKAEVKKMIKVIKIIK